MLIRKFFIFLNLICVTMTQVALLGNNWRQLFSHRNFLLPQKLYSIWSNVRVLKRFDKKSIIVHLNTKWNLSEKLSAEVNRLHYQKKLAKKTLPKEIVFNFTRTPICGTKFTKETFARFWNDEWLFVSTSYWALEIKDPLLTQLAYKRPYELPPRQLRLLAGLARWQLR